MRWTFKLYDASGDGALEQQEVAGDDVLGDLDDGLGDLEDGRGGFFMVVLVILMMVLVILMMA